MGAPDDDEGAPGDEGIPGDEGLPAGDGFPGRESLAPGDGIEGIEALLELDDGIDGLLLEDGEEDDDGMDGELLDDEDDEGIDGVELCEDCWLADSQPASTRAVVLITIRCLTVDRFIVMSCGLPMTCHENRRFCCQDSVSEGG